MLGIFHVWGLPRPAGIELETSCLWSEGSYCLKYFDPRMFFRIELVGYR